MITRVQLTNFKCFPEHEMTLRPTTIIVGRNNAGKSTLVEALRLVALVVARYRSLPFEDEPRWLDHPAAARGVSPSLKGMDFNLRSAFTRYGDPPAIIEVTFADEEKVVVFLGPDEQVHAVIRRHDGRPLMNRSQAHSFRLPRVSIQPQVRPLLIEEPVRDERYVRSMLSSTLAPAHFRNQLHTMSGAFFERFAEIAEATWTGLEVQELRVTHSENGPILSLFIRDGDFVAEVGWMGHGLQMWLQTIWFLARVEDHDTVILDEPDVYMHADLQRRLVRLVRGRHPQMIIATHSLEIMSEVDPDSILVIDKDRSRSRYAGSIAGVQRVIDNLGSPHNISLARLWSSRKCLLVEGKDVKYLKRVQDKLYPETLEPFDALPTLALGGWGGWQFAIGSSMFILRNAADQKVVSYCVLDSDYHPPEEIEERYDEARKRGIQLHVWRRKEIENYFLVPETIARLMRQRARRGKDAPSLAEVKTKLDDIADALKTEVLAGYLGEYLHRYGADKHKKALAAANAVVDEAWAAPETRLARVSGKSVLSQLSEWAQTEFSITLSLRSLLNEVEPEELDAEFVSIVRAIEERDELPMPS
jgi:energy-coupling factor transporter ATP-binding protein EcfA2